MPRNWNDVDAVAMAHEIAHRIDVLPVQNSPSRRTVCREFSRRIAGAPREFVLALVTRLVHTHGIRGTAYELLAHHKPTFTSLTLDEIEALGEGINSWWSVDGFARIIAGPAWLRGLISDGAVHRWAQSEDLWWRRAALVSTVALNVRSHGGYGDVDRTLSLCRVLVNDHEAMVVKAMSWALRELVFHDPDSVRAFVAEHEDCLAARVRREVGNKLETGLKNPRKASDAG